MNERSIRRAGIALWSIAAMTVAMPAAVHAQINIGGPGGDPDDGQASVCISANGDLTVSLLGDDCGDFVRDVVNPLTVGPGGLAVVLSASDGQATFGNTATFNGAANFNGATTFSGGTTFGGAVSANGLTSSGGLSNTGSFTNNGSATVTGSLTTGSISGTSANLSGTATVGALVSNGQVRGTSLFTNGNATVQGFFNAQNGANLQGTVQVGTLQVFQGANFNGLRVQGVGTPTADTDAANKAYVDGMQAATTTKQNNQGTDTAAALGGGASYDPATGHVSAPSYTVGTTSYGNVGAALNAANTSGVAYFHTNTAKADGSATGTNATAIGAASTASGASSFAAGDGATASAAGAIAVGQGARATGPNAVAIGAGATATGSVAVGVGASAANGGAAFGDRAVATGANSGAFGPDASATAANAVALGSGSVATVANTVSVGTAAATRRVVNVAAGTATSDAATVGQLVAGNASIAAALGGGATARADGTIGAPSYAFGGNTYGNVGDAVTGLAGLSYDIRKEARRGIAAATAMANAPMPSAPGRTSWAFNGATFHGEVAVGGSISHRFTSEEPLAANVGFAYAKGGNNTVKVGMSGEF